MMKKKKLLLGEQIINFKKDFRFLDNKEKKLLLEFQKMEASSFYAMFN
jgi:hypothetical protein